MDSDREIPVLAGYLTIIQNVNFTNGISLNSTTTSSKISKKKSTSSKYCMLFKASQYGIERLELCESEHDNKNATIVTLENCVKITNEPAPANLITIVTKSGQLVLNAIDEEELKKWTRTLQKVAFKEKIKSTNRTSVIETDNELYYSSYDEGVFDVKLIGDETLKKCKIEPKKYVLELTQTEMQLRDYKNRDYIVSKWPYRFIRKYGYRDGKFTFEAGRKCETGEGMFKFDHGNPQEIFRCMSARMKTMKKLIQGDSSVSLLDCNESQFNAALSMEAGSRSPLPPSPNQKSSEFETAITQSQLSMTRIGICTDSMDFSTASTVPIGMMKNVPPKPPRRSLTPLTLSINNGDDMARKSPPYETVSNVFTGKLKRGNDYELIKTITDAWRTMGIDEPRHTEHSSSPERDLIEFSFQRSNSSRQKQDSDNNNVTPDFTSKIFVSGKVEDNGSDQHYDKLDFLRSNSKISNGYEKISKITGMKLALSPSSGNANKSFTDDYELIGSPSLEIPDTNACRLADDSYLGYGTIRQQPMLTGDPPMGLPLPPSPSNHCCLDHTTYNGLNYAQVSKPKHV
uniref:CSON006122 protein n=1 Tax=Culicoides sonorensis TaxID=179676 RepID=A0A336KCY5_CULSO